MNVSVYTIGHSTHSAEEFVSLLHRHQMTAVADVRSQPYGRFNPQFNRETIKVILDRVGIEYVFLGDELGARSKDHNCYIDGKVCYDLLANTAIFQHGLDRITLGMEEHRIAIMCAEKDPLTCHRAILVSRHLVARGIAVHHILDDGSLESHAEAINRLLNELGLPDHDLFRSHDEIIAEAYRLRAQEIAYTEGEQANVKEASGVTR